MRLGDYEGQRGKAQIGFVELRLFKPAAAISDPPGHVYQGDAREQRPPKWQHEARDGREQSIRAPKYLALHTLDCRSFASLMSAFGARGKNFRSVSKVSEDKRSAISTQHSANWGQGFWLSAECFFTLWASALPSHSESIPWRR